MCWKNTSRINLVAGLLCVFILTAISTSGAEPPAIEVVYPKADQEIKAADSTFIFGHIGADRIDRSWFLEINGQPVAIHRDGGFIAFLPIVPGEFDFKLALYSKTDVTRPLTDTTIKVLVPEPLHTLSDDTLQIVADYNPPHGDIVLTTGDRLEVWFWGTPGEAAWFSVPGAIDSVPMIETPPREQPFWGEAVFGAGAVPESVLVAGIYSGYYIVPESVSVVDAHIVYHLAAVDKVARARRLLDEPFRATLSQVLKYLDMADTVSRLSGYRVSLNHPDYPFVVRTVDSVQIMRHGPRKGYFSIFQPEGIDLMVVSREGDWYRTRLSHSQYAWVDTMSVKRLPRGMLPPRSYLSSIRTYGDVEKLVVEFPLKGRHAFRVYEDDLRTIRIQLFGVTSDTDWIRYDFSDSLVEIATWSQPEDDLYELRLKLTEDIWGYDTYYVGNTFCFQLNKPPARVSTLWGKTIVIDPGHSADDGAVGPTGYTEKEANLGIALVLEKMLTRKGANVVMTRCDGSDVPLYDRPAIARAHHADLFVSIHNNAVPDGVNPFTNHGSSVYYYHPHSMKLARSIHGEILRALGLPDHGLYYGNLAVDRPTQYPAILVECAFQIIPEQEALLKTERFRRRIAEAVVKGLENFLKEYADVNR